ncbi:MAG: succinyl-diaminopimelate desuccinylase, partial [Actinomyces sp.]
MTDTAPAGLSDQPPGGPVPGPVVLPDPAGDPGALALALVDVPSVSGAEAPLADAVQAALVARDHLEVLRHGNTVVARTRLGRAERVVVAGHLDTVPVSRRTGNVPGRLEERDGQTVVWGRGSVDMKGGVAVGLHLAATLAAPRRDVTWVFYDNEEVVDELNGLGLALAAHPDWFEADLAVLGEPTGA